MIRKFAMLMVLTLLMGATGFSQQKSADPTQAGAQPAAGQEEEESTSARKTKPRDYFKWQFDVGGGASMLGGTTRTFVKQGGGVASAGVARNANKYLGLRADFFFVNLPLRDSALFLAQAPGANSHVYGVTLDPIINLPITSKYSGYVLIGPTFLHRSGKLDSSTAIPGGACNAFWTWWGRCYNSSLPVNTNFLTSSQNEFGFNFGFGVARKLRGKTELYAEYRFVHAKHNGITTDVRPITLGIRW